MDLLDRLLAHDAWTTRQLLLRAQPLADAQLDQPIDIGHKSLRATFHHIIANMEIWTDLMLAVPQRKTNGRSIPELLARLDTVAPQLAALAKKIRDTNAWDHTFTDTLDNPPRQKPYATAIAHLITHSMHHRAQLLYMLRILGQTHLPEGDVFSSENPTQK